MQSCARSKTRGLPYPGLVKSLLIEAKLYNPEKEVSSVYKFDATSVEKRYNETKEQSVEEKVDLLSKRVDGLHSKIDTFMGQVEKLAAGLSAKQDEATISETSSDNMSTDQEEEGRV